MANMTPKKRKERRRARIRSRVQGTADKPRLTVFRSLRGMYVQLIDDNAGHTLVSVDSSAVSPDTDDDRTGKVAVAYAVGKEIAKKAKKEDIEQVVFDRAGYPYHGRVKAVADGARDGGLTF